ncbi:helix-turn-helix domain-containing protein [Faecalicatena contorta]|uniref:helix-turn-helix domain-containing protein n=1 Tax=Faecalicatena contorta TaxID=39482 RepID=UPI001F34AB20|nr:helix-turn-helix domain-containing protein [Faecalicatena contorta]MCF2554359.1 helix-turn-helix domain-containing protein [Faecalicatena contorta]
MIERAIEELVTLEELCEILAIGKNTAYDLLKNKEIEAFRIGRNWKIPRVSIEKYILNMMRQK